MNKQAKVLIVEDDKLIQKAMKIQFEIEGFVVKIAEDGTKAMQVLKKWTPSAVILDILMPKKDGYEVLKEIKCDPKLKGMPVLIASNLNQEDEILRGIKLSAAEFYVKSDMKISELIEKTKYYIKMSTHGKKTIGLD